MSDDTDALVAEGLRYQWYANYDIEDEYEKTPRWAINMRITQVDDGDAVKVFDVDHVDEQWIESDTVCNLTETL